MTLDELVTEARRARHAGWDEERARRVFVTLTSRQVRRAERERLVRRSFVAVALMFVLVRGAIGAAGAAGPPPVAAAAGPSPAAAVLYASNASDAGYARD